MTINWAVEYERQTKELEAAKKVIAEYANPRNWSRSSGYDEYDSTCDGPIYDEGGALARKYLGMPKLTVEYLHSDECECSECDEAFEKVKGDHKRLAAEQGLEEDDERPLVFTPAATCCAQPAYHRTFNCWECDEAVCPETHRKATRID